MKIIIFVFAILAASTAVSSAQFFVEGSVSVGIINDKDEGGDHYSSSSFGFRFAPHVGYWLNEKIAVAAGASFASGISKDMRDDPDHPEEKKESERKTTEWGFAISARYKVVEKNKFSLLLNSSIGISESQMKVKRETVTSTSSKSSIAFVVTPSITYDLTEKLTIETYCSFLNFVISSRADKNEATGRKYRDNQISFNTQSVIFGSLGGINIGLIYNF